MVKPSINVVKPSINAERFTPSNIGGTFSKNQVVNGFILARSTLWDIKWYDIPELEVKYKDWFPATDIQINLAAIELKSFSSFIGNNFIPQSTSAVDVTINYIEDNDYTISNWYAKWINKDILNDGKFITPLCDAARKLELIRYSLAGGGNLKIDEKFAQKLYVIPSGQLDYQGNSQTDSLKLSMTLKV